MKQSSINVKSRSRDKKSNRASRNGFFQQIAPCDIIIPHSKDVTTYLKKHMGLKSILPAVVRKVRDVFGPETQLSLTLYRDPEIDDAYLTLSLRRQKYDADFMDTIEKVSEHFHPKLERISGHLLLTTDFGLPGGRHGI